MLREGLQMPHKATCRLTLTTGWTRIYGPRWDPMLLRVPIMQRDSQLMLSRWRAGSRHDSRVSVRMVFLIEIGSYGGRCKYAGFSLQSISCINYMQRCKSKNASHAKALHLALPNNRTLFVPILSLPLSTSQVPSCPYSSNPSDRARSACSLTRASAVLQRHQNPSLAFFAFNSSVISILLSLPSLTSFFNSCKAFTCSFFIISKSSSSFSCHG